MNKSEILASLIEQYKKSVRLPGDISIKDVRTAVEREMGIKIGARKAIRILNEREDLEAIKVTSDNGDTWVWRKKPTPTRKRKTKK